MTNSPARLVLRRFFVFANGSIIFSQKFHDGLNVVRGDHSVGKSTLMDLIFDALGGELRREQWVFPADACSNVCAEIELNQRIFCVKRGIEVGAIPKIDIFEGTFEDGIRSLVGWQTYGPRRSDTKNSFSQLIFELLGWGASKTDDFANLTMHQVLRLLYADQETPANKIFRAEPQNADSEAVRLAVAEFLLSLDDLEMHRVRQELLIANRMFDKANSELTAIFQVLGKDAGYSVEKLNHEIADVLGDIRRFEQEQKATPPANVESSQLALNPEIEILTAEIEKLSAVISERDANLSSYVAEIADCLAFKVSLTNRKKALLESKTTFESIGSVSFKQCPCCNAEMVSLADERVCPLCKSERTLDEHTHAYLRILTELEFQERQNDKLLNELKFRLETETVARNVITQELNAKKTLLRTIAGAMTKHEADLIEVSRKLGFAESQVANLSEKILIVQKVDDLRAAKLNFGLQITGLNDQMNSLMAAGAARRKRVLEGIGRRALEILELDEKYEPVFKNATETEAEIDFAKDRWLVDGRSKFSGSSNFFKKNALHVAMLSYAIADPKCRHPRFLILDDIENGGMTAPRSQNFQRILSDIIKGNEEKCQVIVATAMVDPSLDNDIFGVGQSYPKGDYVFKI